MDPGSVDKSRKRQAKARRIAQKEGKAGPKWQEYQKAKTLGKKRKLLEDPEFRQTLVEEALRAIDSRLLRRSHDFVCAVATCRRVTSRWPEHTAKLQAVTAVGQIRVAALEGVRRDLEEHREGHLKELQSRAGKESQASFTSIASLISIAGQLQTLQEEAGKVASTTACIDNLVGALQSAPVARQANNTPGSSASMLTEEDMVRQQLAAVLDDWC